MVDVKRTMREIKALEDTINQTIDKYRDVIKTQSLNIAISVKVIDDKVKLLSPLDDAFISIDE